ncbi:MAG: DUF1318 domain-containing protein [Planctomycetota bacterium]|jgi:uncharacterized protein YdbL (DUF1318 family)|nr:DUF1318 domain-containing protein [Planctomycetota bacterium]
MKRTKLPLLVICCFVASCANVTINVNFPPSEIQKAAEKIEGEIRQGEPAPETDGNDQTFKRRRFYFLPSVDFQAVLAEANVNLNITTPGIRKMIESRKARYPQLKPHLDKGIVGEGNKGLLVVRSLSGLGGRDKVMVKRLVSAENNDRTALVKEFARANGINPKKLSDIVGPFTEAIRAKVDKGHWYQDDAGGWKQK